VKKAAVILGMAVAVYCVHLVDGLDSRASEFDFKVFRSKRPLVDLRLALPSTSIVEADVTEWSGAQGFLITLPLKGNFTLVDGALLLRDSAIELKPETGAFSLRVALSGAVTPIMLTQVAADGTVKQEEVQIAALDWNRLMRQLRGEISPATTWNAGLGLASLNYTQSGSQPLSQFSLSGKLSYSRPLGFGNLDLQGNLYGTLLPLTSSVDGVYVRQIGLNLRVGRSILTIRGGYNVLLYGGGFYSSAYSADDSRGFKNLMGLQAYPAVQKRLNARQRLDVYLKVVPLFGLSLEERELAVGASWSYLTLKGRVWSAQVDWSDILINASGGERVQSRNVVFGITRNLY